MGRPREGWKLRDPRPPAEPFYTVRFTSKAGRRVELSTGTSDPHEAARVAADLYARDQRSAAARSSAPRVSPLLALDELFAMWLADLEKTHDRETVVTYTSYARRFVGHFGSIDGVTRPKMADYQRSRLTQVVRDTVQKERSALNTFLAWCVEQEILGEEDRPAWPSLPKKALGKRSGSQRAAPVDVTRDQVGAFLRALPVWSRVRMGERHAIRPRFIVMYETGLRPATLDALRVPEHWRPGDTELRIGAEDDKTRYGRKLPISALAKAALEYVVAERGITTGPIFGEHDYRAAVEAARIAADLPEDFAPYDLRHARIGHLLDQPGAEVRAVMFLVGHKLMTTTNHYVRGQAEGARALLSSGEIPGSGVPDMSRAKEGSRTLTGVTPLEPESGATALIYNGSADVSRHGGTEKDTCGQGNGEIPETVRDASYWLSVLRASEAAMERALADELLHDGDDGGGS